MTSPSILFLPGFMCDERLFTPQLNDLSADGISCSVGDLSRACSIERMAHLVLKDAPSTFALAGLSMGGIVALEIYKQAPDRVSHLALLNTTIRADRVSMLRKQQLSRVAHGQILQVLREELKPQYLAQENRDPDILSTLEQMGTELGKDVFCRQTIALIIREAYHDVAARVTCPTLLLTGVHDDVCPVQRHAEIKALIPHAEMQVLDRCGHISTLERPKCVSRALNDLIRQPARALAPSAAYH